MNKDLLTSKEVLVRKEIRTRLEPIYEGPFKVLNRSVDLKTVDIIMYGQIRKISMDRLKPVINRNDKDKEGVI